MLSILFDLSTFRCALFKFSFPKLDNTFKEIFAKTNFDVEKVKIPFEVV